MTATHTADGLSLPHREHQSCPSHPVERREYVIETVVAVFPDCGLIAQMVELIRAHRPDLDADEVLENIERLCQLSETVECARQSLGSERVLAAAVEDYRRHLRDFATERPSMQAFIRHADRAISIVDELEVRRAARR
ncbi:hypothetical protein [Jatrophihabitans sp.]|uniref:hypothetical protein n=1 Tax=Jatrophihabitans sp. TaxID=1932789 RepID=UPI0030C7854C|nr:hypothetical protein [Jatrophihabitans sp.]